jgi:type VI secretion system secreted protein VgrG
MPTLDFSVATGTELSVRRFTVDEAVGALFTVSVWARSSEHALDLDAIVGQAAGLRIQGRALWRAETRAWTGICSHAEVVQVEPTGLSTYFFRVVPMLWLLRERRDNRIFQHRSIPEIIEEVLGGWGIAATFWIDRGRYPKLEYKVQYAESDYDFFCRLLEEAGITHHLADNEGGETELVLSDSLHEGDARAWGPLRFVDNPNRSADREFVTGLRFWHEVRPGAFTFRDYDFRHPSFALAGEAERAPAPEERYEQYHYRPGGFLIEGGRGGGTPVADDKGVARHDLDYGKARARRALAGERGGNRAVAFETNVIDLRPGTVLTIDNHPHPALEAKRLLVLEMKLQGSHDDEWHISNKCVFADVPYLPPSKTQKPAIHGVQSATVVGPGGEEIHTDEFGRVRVQFPWDRQGSFDDNSSCWVRVSQGWAGTGYGMMVLPRVGQEVLVGFLEGDPDQPIVVGRVFNAIHQVPYRLPEHKTRSTWKSDSSPGSGGFNEIMFEDLKGKELVWVQAERNLRKLVKHDETVTVGRDRQKLVHRNELEKVGVNRTEVTGALRTEITGADRLTVVGGDHQRLVQRDETELTKGNLAIHVGRDHDIIVREMKRERVEGDSHFILKGKRMQRIDGKQSLSVGKDRHERVGRHHLLEAHEAIHMKAGTVLVLEARDDVTIKGPGGFIRIDGQGITIEGQVVKINCGGAAEGAKSAEPERPEEAVVPEIEPPVPPDPDDVLVTGIAQ